MSNKGNYTVEMVNEEQLKQLRATLRKERNLLKTLRVELSRKDKDILKKSKDNQLLSIKNSKLMNQVTELLNDSLTDGKTSKLQKRISQLESTNKSLSQSLRESEHPLTFLYSMWENLTQEMFQKVSSSANESFLMNFLYNTMKQRQPFKIIPRSRSGLIDFISIHVHCILFFVLPEVCCSMHVKPNFEKITFGSRQEESIYVRKTTLTQTFHDVKTSIERLENFEKHRMEPSLSKLKNGDSELKPNSMNSIIEENLEERFSKVLLKNQRNTPMTPKSQKNKKRFFLADGRLGKVGRSANPPRRSKSLMIPRKNQEESNIVVGTKISPKKAPGSSNLSHQDVIKALLIFNRNFKIFCKQVGPSRVTGLGKLVRIEQLTDRWIRAEISQRWGVFEEFEMLCDKNEEQRANEKRYLRSVIGATRKYIPNDLISENNGNSSNEQTFSILTKDSDDTDFLEDHSSSPSGKKKKTNMEDIKKLRKHLMSSINSFERVLTSSASRSGHHGNNNIPSHLQQVSTPQQQNSPMDDFIKRGDGFTVRLVAQETTSTGKDNLEDKAKNIERKQPENFLFNFDSDMEKKWEEYEKRISYIQTELEKCDREAVHYRVMWQRSVMELEKMYQKEKKLVKKLTDINEEKMAYVDSYKEQINVLQKEIISLKNSLSKGGKTKNKQRNFF